MLRTKWWVICTELIALQFMFATSSSSVLHTAPDVGKVSAVSGGDKIPQACLGADIHITIYTARPTFEFL